MNRGDNSSKPARRGQQPPRAPQQGAPQTQKGTKDCRRSSCPKTRLNNDTRGTQKESATELKSVGKGKRAGSVVESVSNDECPKSASVQRKLSDDSNASEDYSKDSGCVSWKLSSSDSSSEMSDCTSEGNKPDPQNIDPEISWSDGSPSASAMHGGGRGDERESKDGNTVGNYLPDRGLSPGVAYVSENDSNLMMGETTEGLIREVDELRSENEYLKDEMEELHCEMVEMRDMFQEEEVYQLQELRLQLEQANKTCRILQYRLRKAERRSIRVAQTGQVDGELVRSLEHDIKVAKSVSLRLRNELESVQKKKSLLEVENEVLRERTQELEVAKQVLQTEVDKVFSKENSLKRRSVRSPISKAERRLSQLIEEDSADLKCQLHFAKEELALMCKKLTKLVSESEGMRVELVRYHLAYGDVDPNQFPEGKASYARSRETEVKAHLKLVEEEATLLSRRIVELEVENRGLRSEMSDMRDKCGGAMEEEEEEPMELVPEKLVPQVDVGWELKERGQSGTMGHTTEYTQDNKANGTTDAGVVESFVLRDGSPAQTKGMLSVCQITRESPVGGEWSPLVQEEVSGRKEDRALHGKTVKDYETLLSLKEHACIVSSAIQLLTSPSNGLSSTPVAMPETGFQNKAQPPGQTLFIQGAVNESLALLQNMLLAFIGHLEKLMTYSGLGDLSFQKGAHFCDSFMLPIILREFAGHNMDAQNVIEHNMMEEACATDIEERVKHTQQGSSSQFNMMQSRRDPKVLLILQAISVLHRWGQVNEPGRADNEARAKTIYMLQKVLHELEAECPNSQTACDSEPKAVRCKTNEDASACAISNERRYFEIDRTYKAEGKRSRRPFAPRKSNRKHWFYLSQSVAQLDQEEPVKTWDHPIMPCNFPDLDFEQISTERSHTAPESTAIRIYYSPPSARRVHLAQLRQSPTTDRESVTMVSRRCTPGSPLSPLYLGLSANLSDDMKEMTASWRRVAHSSHPEEERRRSSGAWVEVSCSGTQTRTQPQMVSVGLQTDGPQGVASVRNSPSRVQSPSSARALHNSTSAEKVNGRAARPRQTSPKLYRRHSASCLTSTTFSSSSLASSPSSSSSSPSRERALVNLSNQGPARKTWARPAHKSTLNTDFGSASRAAKPPSKAAGNHRYGLVTEFLRKVSGRAEKPAPGAGPKGKSELKNLERIPTRPPAVPLHRTDSVTRIVNKRFMKQGEEKGSGQSQAIRGAIARDGSSSSVTAEEGNYDCSSGSTLTFCFARPQRQTLNPGKPQ
ncbi:uncharacterized protein si:ch211-197l9.2 [Gadus chalcogrammus]|uniref:uncharacterized protein si:ch211-197l9.2 n=1 Tax=Gadus chalcogrammus TaxID=1042646 RepID=UPI0024C2C824|nr:uncharacterized protein si:ch211-197l9.2 [Gadus chalcogrammus]